MFAPADRIETRTASLPWRVGRDGPAGRAGWHHGGVDVDDLYGLPMDEFVPARNELARELRNSGKRDEARQALRAIADHVRARTAELAAANAQAGAGAAASASASASASAAGRAR